jgi:phage terminase large subunit-like protein
MNQFDFAALEQMSDSDREAFMEVVFERLMKIKGCEWSLHEFVKNAWSQVEGDKPFVDGWHIGAICEHLEACYKRQIRRLIINIPPRCMKSTLISVMWPAWVWLQNPGEQFLFASHGSSLAIRDSVKCRRVISSKWYQERWGDRFVLIGDQNTKTRFDNNKGGYRISTSVESKITGEGGMIQVTDDPNDASDRSDLKLQNAIDWFSGTWSSRKNNPETNVMVNVQQRISEKDVTGYLLKEKEDGWVHLCLPMEFEESRRCSTVVLSSTGEALWSDPRKKEGELLWPEYWKEDAVKKQKKDLGSEYNIAGQFQQRPAPVGGGWVKKEWFQIWKEANPPKLSFVIQSWDTAFLGTKDSASSACVTLGVFQDENQVYKVVLLNLWKGRLEYPELRKIAQEFYLDYRNNGVTKVQPDGKHRPSLVLIEGKATGYTLIQDFRRAGIPAVGFDPSQFNRLPGDGKAKDKRLQLISPLIESGRVWVAAKPPNFTFLRRTSEMLVENCAMFPNGDSRDVVDAFSQALIRLSLSGWIANQTDQQMEDTSMRIKMKLYG